jgi:cobalt-zinc-cadmium efflux system outer membrane protein
MVSSSSRVQAAGLAASLGLLAFVASPASLAAGPDSEHFQPTATLELADLQQVLRESAPELETAQLQVELAHADVRQSRLLPNPALDFGWGTVPVGTTNPPNLAQPLVNVPNYGVGISFLVELGKRGPRIRESRALERGVRAEVDAVTRARALDLAQTLGELAIASLRLEDFEQVVADMQRSVAAAEQRVQLSFGTALDVERLQIELTRAQAQVLAARSDITGALADCAAQVGRACESFASGAEARAYLEAWIDSAPPERLELEQRPDLLALAHYTDAAQAAGKLARAQAIPDPRIRFGYLHDQFVISGNQLNSLSVSLSIPLPVFDRGQAAREAADARKRRIAAEREKRIAAAQAQVPALSQQAELERERRRALRDEAIPTAKAIATDMESAAEQRLTSISEVVQARRTVRELLLEEADAYAAAYVARIEFLRAVAPTPEDTR